MLDKISINATAQQIEEMANREVTTEVTAYSGALITSGGVEKALLGNAPAIVKTVKGKPAILNDSTETRPINLKIHGPATISKIKFNGSQVLRPELYDGVKTVKGVTATSNKDGSVTFTGTPTVTSGVLLYYNFTRDITPYLIDRATYTKMNDKQFIVNVYDLQGKATEVSTFTFDKANTSKIMVFYGLKYENYTDGMTIYPMLAYGTEPLPFEPFREQIVNVSEDILGKQPVELGENDVLATFVDEQGVEALVIFRNGDETFDKVVASRPPIQIVNLFKPSTVISTDEPAEIEVEYYADTKAYIDNKVKEIKNAIISLGGNV